MEAAQWADTAQVQLTIIQPGFRMQHKPTPSARPIADGQQQLVVFIATTIDG
jgi:hypothetical protein